MDKVMPAVGTVVSSDDCSVVTARDINVNAKSLKVKIEAVSDPEPKSGNADNGADYVARGGSVICVDKISGTIDGDVDLSVSVKKSKVRAGQVDETLAPSSQDPAVKFIIEHKVALIDCLMADHLFILQHVHAKDIVTHRQYWNMKHTSQPEQTVTELIDQMIGKGQESCSRFLQLLKEPDVLSTYPQLQEMTSKMR
ncbi:uncharacterized protein si:dkey-10c21.1 [Labrus bergylta]|uniref:uncharacterized protein si:dkey-10c21.1 n=1 Tax=Labrus bergylta TaxID=56723 RepID=UPI003313F978